MAQSIASAAPFVNLRDCQMRLGFLLALGLFTIGCADQKAWVYRPNEYQQTRMNVAPQKVAVVLPFDDQREDTNHNRIPLCMIPLMPFGWADCSAPEGATAHVTSGLWVNYKPTEDYEKALAQELTQTGQYKQAYFSFNNQGARARTMSSRGRLSTATMTEASSLTV
jgi:hypothetical protein